MKSSDLPPTENNPHGDRFVLIIFENRPNGDVDDTQEGVTLSDAEWDALGRGAAARGETISEWLERIFRENLPDHPPSSANLREKQQAGAGWFKMNYSNRNLEELRALAECAGMDLKLCLRLSLQRQAERLLRRLQMPLHKILTLTKSERRAIGRKNQWIKERMGSSSRCCAEWN